jgi:hypothetical protein
MELKLRLVTFDMLNDVMIPKLANPNGAKPSERWDFSSRKNLLDNYGSIEKEHILLWGEECL